MFDCVGYVFGSGLVFHIDKKEKEKRKKGKRIKGGGGEEDKKRIEVHLLFLICRLGDWHSRRSSDQWPPEK